MLVNLRMAKTYPLGLWVRGVYSKGYRHCLALKRKRTTAVSKGHSNTVQSVTSDGRRRRGGGGGGFGKEVLQGLPGCHGGGVPWLCSSIAFTPLDLTSLLNKPRD